MKIKQLGNTQLSIQFETKAQEAIRGLLDCLNMDRAKKYHLALEMEMQEPEKPRYTVACVKNGEDALFNIVDQDGNIPVGFCVCWRSFFHITRELDQ